MMKLLLSGSAWYQLALLLGLGALALSLRRRGLSARRAPPVWALSLFYGIVIATMAGGHLTAVSIKASQGTLSASASLPIAYAVGLVLLFPALALVAVAGRVLDPDAPRRPVVALNAFLGVALAIPLASAPLTAPAIANLLLLRKPSRRAERAITTVTILLYLAMLVVSFFVGRSF